MIRQLFTVSLVLLNQHDGIMTVSGLAASSPAGGITRRGIFRMAPLAFVAVVSSNNLVQHLESCECSSCGGIAMAYERRDVGGDSPSPEMTAMNDQAYQTMNRLEKDGVKLETAEQQRSALSAALADYSYQPETKKDRNKSTKKAKNPGSAEKS